MYIFIFALSALILLILLVFFIIKRADQTAKPVSNIKLAFYHQNGNLDFYVTTDNEFISRIHNHQFNLQDVERIEATADETIVFEKTRDHVQLDAEKIEKLFKNHIGYVTYQIYLKNNEKIEAVVDVATNKRPKQREELKQSLNKLTNLLNQLEMN